MLVLFVYFSPCTVAGPFLIACGPAAKCPTTTTQVSPTVTPSAGSTADTPAPTATTQGSTADTSAPTATTQGSTADTPAPIATIPGSTADTPAPTATIPGSTVNTRHFTLTTRQVSATPETKTLYLHVKPKHKLLGVTKKECEATKFSIVPIEGSH